LGRGFSGQQVWGWGFNPQSWKTKLTGPKTIPYGPGRSVHYNSINLPVWCHLMSLSVLCPLGWSWGETWHSKPPNFNKNLCWVKNNYCSHLRGKPLLVSWKCFLLLINFTNAFTKNMDITLKSGYWMLKSLQTISVQGREGSQIHIILYRLSSVKSNDRNTLQTAWWPSWTLRNFRTQPAARQELWLETLLRCLPSQQYKVITWFCYWGFKNCLSTVD
jgi:hypothetical protein